MDYGSASSDRCSYGGGSGGDDSRRAVNPGLPAVIPQPRAPSSALPLWRRFVLLRPWWRLAVVAVLAASVGVVTAKLWPLHNNLAALLRPVHPAPEAASPSPPIRITTAPPSGITADVCQRSLPGPQVVVGGPPTLLPADAPASFGVTVDGVSDGAQLVVCGFAARSVISAGRSIDEKTWILPVSDIMDATLIPPRGFVGPMQLVVALLNADNSLADRRRLHLQWLPKTGGLLPATMPRMAEVNAELEEGKRLKAAGDLGRARTIFLRIAQTGDSRAAFLLAETYDPISLAKHQLLPPDSDIEKARLWYRRASERGSQEANARLDRLSNW
jgi:hypothetical protein